MSHNMLGARDTGIWHKPWPQGAHHLNTWLSRYLEECRKHRAQQGSVNKEDCTRRWHLKPRAEGWIGLNQVKVRKEAGIWEGHSRKKWLHVQKPGGKRAQRMWWCGQLGMPFCSDDFVKAVGGHSYTLSKRIGVTGSHLHFRNHSGLYVLVLNFIMESSWRQFILSSSLFPAHMRCFI
jgi:hypothetical protein